MKLIPKQNRASTTLQRAASLWKPAEPAQYLGNRSGPAQTRTRRPSPLDAGACQQCVTPSTGRRSGPAVCHSLAPHPEVVGLCPKKKKRSNKRISSSVKRSNKRISSSGRGLSPPPYLVATVEGGWGELDCSQNVKRSLPNISQSVKHS